MAEDTEESAGKHDQLLSSQVFCVYVAIGPCEVGNGMCHWQKSIRLKGFVKSYAKIKFFLSTLPLFQNNKSTWIVKDQW